MKKIAIFLSFLIMIGSAQRYLHRWKKKIERGLLIQ